MILELDLQLAHDEEGVPTQEEFESWVSKAIEAMEHASLTIRIVDEAESRELNETYRKKNGATNVLSFPADTKDLVPELLGDIIICKEKVISEANSQNKDLNSHWAHLVIHGVLHLQGYDHIQDNEAETMEDKEITILNALGFTNPYIEQAVT
ncbi:MAG: rRNA maturation RNase YbeY [Pseudomonadota bacterium]